MNEWVCLQWQQQQSNQQPAVCAALMNQSLGVFPTCTIPLNRMPGHIQMVSWGYTYTTGYSAVFHMSLRRCSISFIYKTGGIVENRFKHFFEFVRECALNKIFTVKSEKTTRKITVKSVADQNEIESRVINLIILIETLQEPVNLYDLCCRHSLI